jgi:hypothetical protein
MAALLFASPKEWRTPVENPAVKITVGRSLVVSVA